MNWFKKLIGRSEPTAPQTPELAESEPDPAPVGSLSDRFGHLRRPAVHLRSGTSDGFSRLGGLPEMPAHLEWPSWKDKPLAFLAQLDLAEIHGVLPSFLPASGYLFFFYDQEQSVWGFDPKDLGGWRVLFATGDHATWKQRPAPPGLEAASIYQPKPVSPVRIEMLPDTQSLPDGEFDWDRDGDEYSELRDEVFEGQTRHQVLGYPTPVQNADMEEECQFAANGINVGTAEGYKDPRVPALKAGAAEWKLLLQLDTDDDTGWMWGDVGTLYFWVRESDARAGDFSKVWMVFQCC